MKTSKKNCKGLLHYRHKISSGNPFDSDLHQSPPSPALIEEASRESHHGVVREKTARKIGREEEAKLALEHTEITRATGWLLTLAFLLTIFSVPLIQSFLEVRENLAARQKKTNGSALATTGVLPHVFDSLQELPTRNKIENVSNWRDAWALLPEADLLKMHESTLEDESFLAKWMLPRVSGVLLHAGLGNEQVVLGRSDKNGQQWLFYKADVDYLSSKGFLDPALQRVRERSGEIENDVVQRDSVHAILDFQKQLAARKIQLVVMPMPVKPMLEAEHLVIYSGLENTKLQNPSYSLLLQSLQKSGVAVFDPTPILQARKTKTGQSQFLRSDTHWTPDAMQTVARELSKFLQQNIRFDGVQQEYSRRWRTVENSGDTADMLTLSENQNFFSTQKIQIEAVFDKQGAEWKSDKNAQLLLLGDSFCNIYSLPEMGWGKGAGFAPQLSHFLKRPVDSIVVNAGGSHTSRQRLIQEMRRNPARLQNTKVVVWEFSMRDLLGGNWKILPLPTFQK